MKLGNLCDIVRGSSPRPQGDLRYYGGSIPRLMIADVTRDGTYVTPQIDSLTEEGAMKSRPMKKGDVIIAVSGDPGRACILNVDACIHDGFVGLRNLNETKLHKPYLLNYLAFFKNTTKKGAVGAIFQNLTTDQIKKIDIPEIDMEDQIRIADILSQTGFLISHRKESIRLLDEFLKSTFLDMFGSPNTYSKADNVQPIREICHFKGGGTPSKSKPEYFTGDIPWVSPKDMKSLYIDTSQDKITKQAIDESSTSLISKGAVLMVVRSGILKSKLPVAINKVDVAINQDIKAFISTHVLSSVLMYFFLTNETNILKMVRATTADNFNFEDIKNLPIVVPPMDLQIRFADIVEKAESIKSQYQTSLQELENLYGGLSQQAFVRELSNAKESKGIKLPTILQEGDHFLKRKVLATYLINQSLNDPKFGDTKFEKLLHLSDYHAIKRNLGQKYYQQAAGPYDNSFTRTFFIQVGKSKWFKREKKGTQFRFSAGTNHNKSLNVYGYFSSEELHRVDKLINYFKKSDYEQPEIISTLYAVWNNRIIKGFPIDDNLIKADFLDWDSKKVKYKDRLNSALIWMRKEGLVPNGWGKVIERPKSKRKVKSKK